MKFPLAFLEYSISWVFKSATAVFLHRVQTINYDCYHFVRYISHTAEKVSLYKHIVDTVQSSCL